MPPSRSKKAGSSSKASAHTPPQELKWPTIATKAHLECRVFEQDQILIIDNFLTKSECGDLVKFIDSLPLQLTPPAKRGEADRLNHRHSIISEAFAASLFELLKPHLPVIPSFQHHFQSTPTAKLCNSNIRLYKYTTGQYFGPHYDESVAGPLIPIELSDEEIDQNRSKLPPTKPRMTPTWSEWTILVYLTGHEDGIIGGETVFYAEEGTGKNKRQREIVPPLTRGSVLLHRHGIACLLHEGRLVEAGTKYVLRSDLMFSK